MLPSLATHLPEPIKRPLRRRFGPTERAAAFATRNRGVWERDGYLVLPKLFPAHKIALAARSFDELWASRRSNECRLVVDAFLTNGPEQRMLFRDAPNDARHEVYKLSDVYLADEFVRSLVLGEPLLAALRVLVDDDVVAINSLHFERGSTQAFHVDTFYMPPPPTGRLIVSSICLEDVHPDAGPLKYYPGSHVIEPFLNGNGDRRARDADELCAAMEHYLGEVNRRGLAETRFLGRRGQTFLWHEQLVHGGAPINDMSRTRRSIVTHYWTRSSVTSGDIVPHGSGFYLRRPHQLVEP